MSGPRGARLSRDDVRRYHELVDSEIEGLRGGGGAPPRQVAPLPASSRLKLIPKSCGGGPLASPHGELARKLVNLSITPDSRIVHEFVAFPGEDMPIPDFNARNLANLRSLMTHFIKEVCSEGPGRQGSCSDEVVGKVVDAVIDAFRGDGLSEYQYEMLRRALSSRRPFLLVLTAPTGAGKTRVFLVLSLLYALARKLGGYVKGPHVLLIYPRKALAGDQLRRIARAVYLVNEQLGAKGLKDYRLTVGIVDGDSPRSLGDVSDFLSGGRPIRDLEVEVPGGRVACYYYVKGGKLAVECRETGRVLDYTLYTDLREHASRGEVDLLITNIYMVNEHVTDGIEARLIRRDFKSWVRNSLYAAFIRPGMIVVD